MTGAVLSPAPEHEFRQTADKDEAMDVITRVYVPHDLVLPERTLDMTLAWTPLHSLVLGHLSYGAEAHLIAPKLETCYHVNVTLRGHTRSRRGADEVSTGPDVGLVFLPTEPAAVHWSTDCLQLAMKIDKDALDTELTRLLGHAPTSPLHMDLALQLRRPGIKAFLRALSYLREELEHPEGFISSPLGLAQLENTVMTSLLLSQPSNHLDELLGSTGRVVPRSLRQVVDDMEAHPDVSRTLGEYAAIAGYSARALQDAFRRTLDTTPMAYVRDVRFARVRAALAAAEPGETTVATLLHHWGFSHAGRFSVEYRQRYGESPSQTLRRRNR
jgi:AraC-like DNA-binding protein